MINRFYLTFHVIRNIVNNDSSPRMDVDKLFKWLNTYPARKSKHTGLFLDLEAPAYVLLGITWMFFTLNCYPQVAFQDFCHCMIMTEPSLEDLNSRLPEPMSVIPFRPNVMVDGCKPYDEVVGLWTSLLLLTKYLVLCFKY